MTLNNMQSTELTSSLLRGHVWGEVWSPVSQQLIALMHAWCARSKSRP